jgi:carbamoyl-phosphate synthase large subunit
VGVRLLVTGAGTGASNNLIRSLRAGDPSLLVAGCHADRFFLKKSPADRNYLVPRSTDPDFADGLRDVIGRERIDLLVPNGDTEVRVVSSTRATLPCRVFLPPHDVVTLCQDKYALTALLRGQGIPAPATYPIGGLGEIDDLFARLAPRGRLWCRIRTGGGSLGATPVRSPAQARSWISYWEEMRGFGPAAFTLSEYLPGRDFACQTLWRDGQLVLAKTSERLAYFGGSSGPSGVSSIGGLHKTVHEPDVVEVSARAVRALGPGVSGAFSVDLKQDERGTPSVTEINVGRLLSGTAIFDLTGKHNMAVTYVRLAMGQSVDIAEPYDVAEGHYMVRDLDTLPDIFHADEIFEGIEDARPGLRA